MSALKRTISTRARTLKARKSPHNAEVTLFEPDTDPEPSRRRPKRVKRESNNEETVVKDDIEEKSMEVIATSLDSPLSKSPTKKSPRKPKPIRQALDVPHPAPPRWQETYNIIKQMRSRITAPVDTMGCDSAQHKETEPKNRRFATLVSLMLSSQTKDEVTDAAVSKLKVALGGTLSVEAIIASDNTTISEAINKVGFWRRKTEYIKKAAERLRDDFDSDVPKTVDDLCSLPGVGPKMAFLALQRAWNLNLGIGVDVHVHRITNRLGWHKPLTKNPEETRLNLQSWLPTELHPDINHLLVGFGQTICLPIGPRCDLCDLSSTGLCPSAQKVTNSKGRKAVIFTQTASNSDSPPKIEIGMEEEDEQKQPPLATTIKTLPLKSEDIW